MSNVKPVQLPLAPHFMLYNLQCAQTKAKKQDMANVTYAKAVGCLMYAMVLTKPDIERDILIAL